MLQGDQMRTIGSALALIGLVAAPAFAQGRRDSQGIPPGQVPPAGECRVWYDGRPPGQQPRSTSCSEAERIAARDSRARVIYGSAIPRAIPRPLPPGSAYPDRRGAYTNFAFDTGYQDGYDKGRDDGRGNHRYDPTRQSRFRSADHRYDRRYGSKAEYQRMYRDGFRSGYDEGYRDNDRYSRNRRGSGIRLPWPF